MFGCVLSRPLKPFFHVERLTQLQLIPRFTRYFSIFVNYISVILSKQNFASDNFHKGKSSKLKLTEQTLKQPSQHGLAQNHHQFNITTTYEICSKLTMKTSLIRETSLCCLYCYLGSDFAYFIGVSIGGFKQVNFSWNRLPKEQIPVEDHT